MFEKCLRSVLITPKNYAKWTILLRTTLRQYVRYSQVSQVPGFRKLFVHVLMEIFCELLFSYIKKFLLYGILKKMYRTNFLKNYSVYANKSAGIFFLAIFVKSQLQFLLILTSDGLFLLLKYVSGTRLSNFICSDARSEGKFS